MMLFFHHLFDLTLEAAPWLLAGFILAGLVKAWIPDGLVAKWLGGRGMMSILRGAIVGMPLPLCSCGVIPMMLGLRKQGASKPATVAFLVATPETGVDSIALTWVMLGPFMTVIRPVAAVLSALLSGVFVLLGEHLERRQTMPSLSSAGGLGVAPNDAGRCSSSKCGCVESSLSEPKVGTMWVRAWDGVAYALTDLWDDIAWWLAVGLVLAALVMSWLPPGQLTPEAGAGVWAMITMVLVSIPVYVCATASTPIAAAMLFSGLSPGMTLAFLVAGPATNVATLVLVGRELGKITLAAYLAGIMVSAVLCGLATDWVVGQWQLSLSLTPMANAGEWIPDWLAIATAIILVVLATRGWFRKLRSIVSQASSRHFVRLHKFLAETAR